ncbi:NUDIX domain-containing protein [Geobacillus phage GR1]|nr:NUDIX domain-containing protein [Geobacillus phage GR1]
MGKMDEMIIVAPRSKVFGDEKLVFQGTEQDKKKVDKIVKNISNSYEVMRRGDAEENEDFKQPIPYAVIKRGDEVFVYERLKSAGETRLHNKLSIGVGGHMNEVPGEKDFNKVLDENLLREIEEELVIDNKKFKVTPIGLINDDEDEVGRVHIGILVEIEVPEGTDVQVRETEELQGQFFPIKKLKLKQFYNRLENWSKITIDIL